MATSLVSKCLPCIRDLWAFFTNGLLHQAISNDTRRGSNPVRSHVRRRWPKLYGSSLGFRILHNTWSSLTLIGNRKNGLVAPVALARSARTLTSVAAQNGPNLTLNMVSRVARTTEASRARTETRAQSCRYTGVKGAHMKNKFWKFMVWRHQIIILSKLVIFRVFGRRRRGCGNLGVLSSSNLISRDPKYRIGASPIPDVSAWQWCGIVLWLGCGGKILPCCFTTMVPPTVVRTPQTISSPTQLSRQVPRGGQSQERSTRALALTNFGWSISQGNSRRRACQRTLNRKTRISWFGSDRRGLWVRYVRDKGQEGLIGVRCTTPRNGVIYSPREQKSTCLATKSISGAPGRSH